MKCPKCNGEAGTYCGYSRCSFCHGKKELDWIEYIFGVDPPEQIWTPDNNGGTWNRTLPTNNIVVD